jgi:methyl-accepting chemotaxis protein
MRLFAGRSVKTLLNISVIVPLTGFIFLAGQQIVTSYSDYKTLGSALYYQKIASAGAELALALPSEAFAPNEKRQDARARTDRAFESVAAALTEASAQGMRDQTIEDDASFIQNQHGLLETYRQGIDAANGVITPELRGSAIKLQPVSAAGIDMTRRAGALIGDVSLSHIIQGYFAMMQINDAGLIEMGFGEQYLSEGKINSVQQAFLIHSRSLFGSYTKPMFEFLPPDITQAYQAFLDGQENAFMQTVRDKMYTLQPAEGTDKDAAGRWMKAALTRVAILGEALEKSSIYLQAQAKAKLDDAWMTSVIYGASMLAAILFSLIISLTCAPNDIARRRRRHSSCSI